MPAPVQKFNSNKMKEMKKAIIGLAFLSIAALPFSASAQNQADKSCNSKTECINKNRQCAKSDKKGKCCKIRKCKDARPDLFEGIELTTEQQGKIEALNNAAKLSRQQIKEQAKNAREKKDTTYNPRAAHKELRGKYINDLGEILTSEQMVVYLKNFYVNNASHHRGKKAIAMKHGKHQCNGKGMRHGNISAPTQNASK